MLIGHRGVATVVAIMTQPHAPGSMCGSPVLHLDRRGGGVAYGGAIPIHFSPAAAKSLLLPLSLPRHSVAAG